MNKVWTRICPILGLLLLLSVCPLLSDFSEKNFQLKYQENSDNEFFKQAKCINGSNSFPEGGRGFLSADLSRWFEGHISVAHENVPGTPVFTHYTSARRRYAPHDVAMINENKI